MQLIPFTKMQGAGNDFVIIDDRARAHGLHGEMAVRIADRRLGVGCDQVIAIEPSDKADAFMRIYNADGSEVSACGNATRCVAYLIMNESGAQAVNIETRAGVLQCLRSEQHSITVDMGAPRLDWWSIPLASEHDTLRLPITQEGLGEPVAVSMGNPHMTFFVADTQAVPLERLGPLLEHHPLYPERANVGVAQIVSKEHIRLRVWERGAGETPACGTGACAALVAAARRGLTGRSATVSLAGGDLQIQWSDEGEGHVWMTGPVAISFTGDIHERMLR